MADDRYAPPSAPLSEPASLRVAGRIDLGEAFREAWSATWSNFGVLLLALVAFVVVGILAAVTIVGAFLVLPVLIWGLFRLGLGVIDGQGEFVDLFSGFADYGRVLGATLILFVVVVLLAGIGQVVSALGQASGSASLIFLGGIVNLAWSLGVMARLVFAWFYVVDRGLSPVDALQTSWTRTADQKFSCAVLAILSWLIPLLGLVCLIVGVIPAVMIASLMQAAAYRQLAGR